MKYTGGWNSVNKYTYLYFKLKHFPNVLRLRKLTFSFLIMIVLSMIYVTVLLCVVKASLAGPQMNTL